MHAIKVVAISTSACMLSSSCKREKQLKLYSLQKMLYLLKNSQAKVRPYAKWLA